MIGGMLVVLCLLGSLFVGLRGLLILGALGLLMMVLGPRLRRH